MVTHGTLLTSWTPVLNTGINYGGGTIPLGHTGTNRVYGRVLSASGTLVQTRLVYDVGDMVYPSENPPRRLYDARHLPDHRLRRGPPRPGAHRAPTTGSG